MDGHLLIVEWSSTIPGMVINFPSTVTHRLQDGQLDLEFDSSAAKLVNLIVILAQLVALPAKVVLVLKSISDLSIETKDKS